MSMSPWQQVVAERTQVPMRRVTRAELEDEIRKAQGQPPVQKRPLAVSVDEWLRTLPAGESYSTPR